MLGSIRTGELKKWTLTFPLEKVKKWPNHTTDITYGNILPECAPPIKRTCSLAVLWYILVLVPESFGEQGEWFDHSKIGHCLKQAAAAAVAVIVTYVVVVRGRCND